MRRFGTFAALAFACLLLALPASAQQKAASLAATPPMGWNSWNHYHRNVNDAVVRAQADAMVSSGMRDAGYRYINIDDTWEGARDDKGVIHPNDKFPDMKALADYVHSKGLKLGIYSSPGPKTCAGYEGSFGHEQQDAQTYAAWGIDYLKYDLCSLDRQYRVLKTDDAREQFLVQVYGKMHDALVATGRPIVFSLCEYGWSDPWKWGPSVGGNLWRTTGDISDRYASMANIGFNQLGLAKYAGPGHWNDPDMLEVGNGGMTHDEYLTHMSLWAMLAAPLIAGNDLSTMTPETISILTNHDVIAIDQDPAGHQGERVGAHGPIEIWARPLADGSQAVAVFNRGDEAQPGTVNFKDLGFKGSVHARDVWQARDLGKMKGAYTVQVPIHGVVLLKVSK
ncbi:MAG TPA: glycoside hydrolase family 27 protein [Candidatus Acidoferrales bacterium]|nr:glycoside hydrolase family 27 protein [Candidatus Acidoferrales bacterium]